MYYILGIIHGDIKFPNIFMFKKKIKLIAKGCRHLMITPPIFNHPSILLDYSMIIAIEAIELRI